MSQELVQIESIDELKRFLIKLIRDDVKGYKVFEGSALIPYRIERTCLILEKLGIKIYKCKVCDVPYPLDMLFQVKGRKICGTCREEIRSD